MYRLEHGQIPLEMLILHTCDNPGCVNPNHLYAGTSHDNSTDMVCRNRHVKEQPLQRGKAKPKNAGSRNGNANFGRLEVEAIRKMHDEGWTGQAIAKQFGCAQSTVSRITRGDNYRT